MTTGKRYLLGLAVAGTAALIVGLTLPATWTKGYWLAMGAAFAVQAPLGWWLVRSVGTPRFLRVWVLGMAARLATLGLVAAVVAPRLHWPLEPILFSLAGALVALLIVEGAVISFERLQTEAR